MALIVYKSKTQGGSIYLLSKMSNTTLNDYCHVGSNPSNRFKENMKEEEMEHNHIKLEYVHGAYVQFLFFGFSQLFHTSFIGFPS